MTPLLIKKLSLLILLLQQLVGQLNQLPPPAPVLVTKPAVTKPAAVPASKPDIPIITRVEPNQGSVGTAITIFGSGFDHDHNVIYTGAGTVTVASPDGKTLSFTLPRPLFLTDKWLSSTADYRRQYYPQISFPLGFYVKNENGVTANPGLFSLTI